MDHARAQVLYQQHSAGIYRFALYILKSPAGAEDVLQETFLRLLQSSPALLPGREPAWLYKVARNLCYDQLRSSKREAPEANDTAQVCKELAYLELIAPLEPQEQEIVSLKILGNLTHREIASALGLTTHAAKKRYERAIAKLRVEGKE